MTVDGRRFGYASMGTQWSVRVWDAMDDATFDALQAEIVARSEEFDRAYSRFIPDSLVWRLSERTGIVDVPRDLVAMLRLYGTMYRLSAGKCTPLVGFSLSDLGYDAQYSLQPKEHIRPVPPFPYAVRVIDDAHIELKEKVLLDVGALGKGYFVDVIAGLLAAKGYKRYLVDGSGDIVYRGNGAPIRVGLEHPDDPGKAIGVMTLLDGALCGSGANRRAWNGQHHIIDPHTLGPTPGILATWVYAKTAAVADGLATCAFLTDPEAYRSAWDYEYCVLNDRYEVNRSRGFEAQLF